MENGKKVCNELKEVRKQIALANDIEYKSTECIHTGDCAGTCAKCEEELRYIERELNLRRMLGKAVVVTGLGLSVATCMSGCTSMVRGYMVKKANSSNVDTNEMVMIDAVENSDTAINAPTMSDPRNTGHE